SRYATAIHLLQLPNGKRVKINMHFDIGKWSLCPADKIDNLDDLCFVFYSKNKKKATKFVMRIGEIHCELFDYHLTYARFRVGPILSTLIGETAVLWHCQSRSKKEDPIDTIEVSIRLRAIN
ncbi:hypothetical protein PFISCL1PPCAC_19455, partial [Pristionchus fissidentatus]